MEAGAARRAVTAAMATASALGLAVDDATVLSDSNRLVVRLLPCDIVARVAGASHFASAVLEVEVVRELTATGSPVAPLDSRVEPQVVVHDGFEISWWAHISEVPDRPLVPDEYAGMLERLHAGLRPIEIAAPHVMDRVAAVRRDAESPEATPDLADADRRLLADALSDLGRSIRDRGAHEQLLHGEPHPWNVLDTEAGPLVIDLENAARGPVEYDLAWAPREVSERYAGVDQDLVDACRGVVLAIVAAHRWRVDDRHPSGRRSGVAFLDALRAGPPWPALDEVTWSPAGERADKLSP